MQYELTDNMPSKDEFRKTQSGRDTEIPPIVFPRASRALPK